MKQTIQTCFFILCSLLFVQCDSDRDAYFERPEWLEDPVYQILEQQGRFGYYLQCVDRTSYASVLKGAGLYTVFAPNDEAFAAWLQAKSYASVANIPAEEAERLVNYSIVYSNWPMAHLGDYFLEGKYVPGAFKRKTACYALPYKDAEFDGQWVIDQSVQGSAPNEIHNYKYLPVYTSAYFNTFPVPLTAYDYNVFYPNTVFTGKNVQAGNIVKEDIRACNGIIHEVSTVNEPMDNIEHILQQAEYQELKSLIDHKNITGEYAFKAYAELSPSILERYRKMLPDETINALYLKYYTSLAFSPALENVFSLATGKHDPEKTGYTLFAPAGNVLKEFIQNKLLKYYQKVEDLPLEIISTLINTHMAPDLVWPSLYQNSVNATGEFLNGEGDRGKKFDEDGIFNKTMASNGFVFQTDHVIKSRFFETVYSEIFLNPVHSLLNRAYLKFYENGLREDLMKSVLSGYTSERYTILNFSDELLKADGFSYSTISGNFSNAEMSTGAASDDRIKRLLRMHVFPGLKNDSVDSERKNFSGANISYGQWGFTVSQYGDPIRFKNNQLQAAGNIEDNTLVTLTPVQSCVNGQVFNVDKMLQYSPRETAAGDGRWQDLTLWKYLERAKTENTTVSEFVNYVEKCLKNPDTNELDGIKPENYYTVLMPNNAAIQQAINRGHLKPLGQVSADNKEALAQATKFVNAHFLQGRVLMDDGATYIYPVNPMESNKVLMPTLLKINSEGLDLTNERTFVEITKTAAGLLSFLPQDIMRGSKILVDGAIGTTTALRLQRGTTGSALPDNFKSNRIACKAVLHEINNFFVFEELNP